MISLILIVSFVEFKDRHIVGSYLRVGFWKNGNVWRNFKLRQDFISADKVQMEGACRQLNRSLLSDYS